MSQTPVETLAAATLSEPTSNGLPGLVVGTTTGHADVQIGDQVWSCTDKLGCRPGDMVVVVEQGNTREIIRNRTSVVTVPIGGTILWWSDTPPDGWWIMQGQALDATLYPVCSAIFGANLPDPRDVFPLVASASRAVRSTGGSSTISTSNLPAHTHSIPSHSHAVLNSGSNIAASGTALGQELLGSSSSRGWRTESGGSGDTGSVGSGSDYRPKYIAVHLIVRMG